MELNAIKSFLGWTIPFFEAKIASFHTAIGLNSPGNRGGDVNNEVARLKPGMILFQHLVSHHDHLVSHHDQ